MLTTTCRITITSIAHARSTLFRALSTSRPAAMPLYICYCPDYPGNLETRLSVRDAHLADAVKDKETGASGEWCQVAAGQGAGREGSSGGK